MKSIFGIPAALLLPPLLLLLGCGGGGQLAEAKGDILYRNICLCGYRGWERKYIADAPRPPLAPEPKATLSPIIPIGPVANPPPFPPEPLPLTPNRPPPPSPVSPTFIIETSDTTPTTPAVAAVAPRAEAEAEKKKLLLAPRGETVYEDLILAYFLKMTFYQHHLETNFTFTRECAPGAPCHDYNRTHKRCQKFPLLPQERGRHSWHRHKFHKLCYQVRDLPKRDRYWFDRHMRGANVDDAENKDPYMVERQPRITDEIERECGGECRARFGMEVVGGKMVWRSTVDRITGEADMCLGCA